MGTVCCADDLPSQIIGRPQSFIVNTDCEKGMHWVAFHFPAEGTPEFFDSFGRDPESYHKRFEWVLIANGPNYVKSVRQVQPSDSDTCGLYCVHYLKSRYSGFTYEEVMNDVTRKEPLVISNYLKMIYE